MGKETDPDKEFSLGQRLLLLGLPCAVFFLLLLGAEICVRILCTPVSVLDLWVDSPVTRMGFHDRQKNTIFEGNALLLWGLKQNLEDQPWDFTLVSTNSDGLRYGSEIGRKSEDAVRVLAVGDSVTFGYRIPVVWPENPTVYDHQALPYPALLENTLRAANPGKTIEVVPLAVPGYTSYQGLNWVRSEIDRLKPNLITICFGWNDITLSSLPDKQTWSTNWFPVTVRSIVLHSQAIAHLSLWLKSKRTPPPYSSQEPVLVPRVSSEDYAANILKIAELAKAHDASVIVLGTIFQGNPEEPAETERIKNHRDALRKQMTESNIPYLEIPQLTEAGFPDNQHLFGERIHPGDQGHRLMAGELLKFIGSYHLLPKITVPGTL